ncbi:Uncharacterised protein [Mycobacteroides abscessus subsp. abscessus]|nr:Uncharacterised protein [Mycobacteroides abscessus subsp. abscessus]
MGGQCRRPKPGRYRGSTDEARLKGQTAHQQIARQHQLRAQHRTVRPKRRMLGVQSTQEEDRGQPLPHQIGHRRTGQPHPRHTRQPVDQHRAQYGRHGKTGDDISQRPHRILNSPHPAVARQGHQNGRCREDGDTQPPQALSSDIGRRGNGAHHRPGHRMHDEHHDGSDEQRQPGGLHALMDRARPVAGSESPRGARGGAVRQKGQLRPHQRKDQSPNSQSRQRDRSQAAHHGDVEKQIQRFGCQDAQCGQRQRNDPSSQAGHSGDAGGVSQGREPAPPPRHRPDPSPRTRLPADVHHRRKWPLPRKDRPRTARASIPTNAPARFP